ncbi:MAG TPA: 3,4-dihydroxy-2-butanone-4-phosphate synthase [Gaiellales bacterium]|nr:3,4-dihydroxy-2-butanone-4-phosphate synthase [Gaiellales bacterium]
MSAAPEMPGSLARALERLRSGGMVVVCDDPDREDEGDLCMAARLVTPEAIAFMACHARGLICVSLPEERCDELELPLMVPANEGTDATGFTVSIEAATGVTTGISAADRARTIRVAVDPATRPADLVRPGHVFPLRARRRGVLERRGQTEAAVDLTRLAGLTPGGVLCEVINDDGTMARGRELQAFCRRHGLPVVTVEHIAGYVRDLAPTVTAV